MTSRAQLDPAAADKLTKILGLLGSDHPGERDAAAQAANKLVRERGLTWADIVAPPIAPDHVPRIRSWRADDSDWAAHGRVLPRSPMASSAERPRICQVDAQLAPRTNRAAA